MEGIAKGFRPQKNGFFQLGTKYYKLGIDNADWYDAVHVCHTVGAQLISLNDSAMLKDMSSKIQKKTPKYWVDLSDHSNLGNVTSITTGQAPNFVKWCEKTEEEAKEEPNQEKTPRCVYIENGKSETNPCMKRSSCRSISLSYVCELDNPKTITILVK